MSTSGYDPDSKVNEGNSHDLIHNVIFGICVTLGILTSLLLMSWPVILRRQKSLPFFVVLASWCLANLLYLIVFAVSHFPNSSGIWTLGEFGCRASRYLRKSLGFTRVYLMILAAIMTFFGNQRFQRLLGSRERVRVLVPGVASTVVWIMIFLPCIQYWYQPRLVHVGTIMLRAYWCIVDSTLARMVLELCMQCLVPYILTAVFLMAWGWGQQKIKMADRRENVQAILLLIMMHLAAISQFIALGVVPLALTGVVGSERAGTYFDLSDYTLSPLFCLIAIYYRRLFTSHHDPIPTEDPAEDVAAVEK